MSRPTPITFKWARCPGEAHNPEVGGMIDNCGVCAPRWGWVVVQTGTRDRWDTMSKATQESLRTRWASKNPHPRG